MRSYLCNSELLDRKFSTYPPTCSTAVRLLRLITPFFFQAEDGIRDRDVTGVQTCALPICISTRRPAYMTPTERHMLATSPRSWLIIRIARSEERRVGKECRSLW